MLPLGAAATLPARAGGGGSVAVIAAHPDDEVLGLGGRLAQLPGLTLVHLTDGAPRDMADARRAGYRTRRQYALARERELERALIAAGASVKRRMRLGLPDQEAVLALAQIARRIVPVLAGVECVYTHSYEGGHPDHDAAALVTQAACMLLERSRGYAPARHEFASYHLRGAEAAYGVFWPDPRCRELALQLDAAQLARKRAALEQFTSQRAVIARFEIAVERERPAPRYDFTAPPPPGAALYDRWGWRVRSAGWRVEAASALRALEGHHARIAAEQPA